MCSMCTASNAFHSPTHTYIYLHVYAYRQQGGRACDASMCSRVHPLHQATGTRCVRCACNTKARVTSHTHSQHCRDVAGVRAQTENTKTATQKNGKQL